jgi:hypothetical protein
LHKVLPNLDWISAIRVIGILLLAGLNFWGVPNAFLACEFLACWLARWIFDDWLFI